MIRLVSTNLSWLKPSPFFQNPTRRILVLALVIFVLDQFTKWLVLHTIYEGDEIIIIPDFSTSPIAPIPARHGACSPATIPRSP